MQLYRMKMYNRPEVETNHLRTKRAHRKHPKTRHSSHNNLYNNKTAKYKQKRRQNCLCETTELRNKLIFFADTFQETLSRTISCKSQHGLNVTQVAILVESCTFHVSLLLNLWIKMMTPDYNQIGSFELYNF